MKGPIKAAAVNSVLSGGARVELEQISTGLNWYFPGCLDEGI